MKQLDISRLPRQHPDCAVIGKGAVSSADKSPFREKPLLVEVAGAKHQASLQIYGGWGSVDISKAESLLESSFGKTLVPGYFSMPADKIILYGNGRYDGIAVIKSVVDTPYMDKLAVAPDLKSNGVGRTLMDAIKH
jgi:ribosomal protein S18 acetylase RimI-like enzyme